MIPFEFSLPTQVVFGSSALDRLGQLTRDLVVERVLVVSDPGVVEAGHTAHGLESLRAAGLETCLFDGARENPTTEHVAEGVRLAREFSPQCIVGLGGGSSMDCAKGINFLYTNGGEMKDYWGVGKATQAMLPLVAVPTTAGTGSELQSFALISDSETHAKMACGDKKALCKIAILDPDLTLTQPAQVTALTGIDAISHALETFVTRRRNEISKCFSREAWLHLATSFGRVIEDPNDREARANMQLGASYAGMAIENSMLGAGHSLANPLTATYDIAHGQAVGVMLPHVIRYNSAEVQASYEELIALTAGFPGMPQPAQGIDGLAEFVTRLLAAAGLETRLQMLGVKPDDMARLSAQADQQWTKQFNPRQVDQAGLHAMYEQAF